MVDPRSFKHAANVGQWVDAMVRLRGPAVDAINGVLLSDWYLETTVPIDDLLGHGNPLERPRAGPGNVQVLPSGPAGTGDAIL